MQVGTKRTARWAAIAAVVVAGTVGTALAGTASAATTGPDDTTAPARGDRAAMVCDHLDQIESAMSTRLEHLASRQSWLATKRAAAVEAGRDRVVERIDRVSARLTEQATKVHARSDKLTTWAGEHCDVAG